MKCLCVLLCALACCAGCNSDGDKDPWAEFRKDLRGDNMQMRNDFSRLNDADGPPVQSKPRE